MPLDPREGNLRPTNPVLSRIVAGYAQDARRFLANSDLLPTMFDGSSVADGDETYFTGTIQRLEARAAYGEPGAKTEIDEGEIVPLDDGADLDPMTYRCRKYARRAAVNWEEKRKQQLGGADAATQLKLAKAQNVLLVGRERILANLFTATGNWPTNLLTGVPGVPGANQFQCFNIAGSNVNTAFNEACQRVDDNGMTPNTVVFGNAAFRDLQTNASFVNFDSVNLDRTMAVERALGTGAPRRVQDIMASRFGLTRCYVGKARRNTLATRHAAPTNVDIWPDSVWIGYLPETSVPAPVDMGDDGKPMFDFVTPMAAGKIVASPWSVRKLLAAGEERDQEQYMIRYAEWVGIVSEALGCLMTNTRN